MISSPARKDGGRISHTALAQLGSLDDAALVALIEQGDERAFEHLHDRCAAAVYRLASRMLSSPQEAEDVTQEVFLILWRRGGSYRPEQGPPTPWLMAIARRRCIDRLRALGPARRRELALQDERRFEAGAEPPLVEAAIAGERRRGAANALARLPAAQRSALLLAYMGGLTHAEIAEVTLVPLGTAKSRLRLGLEALREQMGTPTVVAAAERA